MAIEPIDPLHADLLFTQVAPASLDLVFGATGGDAGAPATVNASVAGALPKLGGVVHVALANYATMVGMLPPLGGGVTSSYVSGAQRPLVNETGSSWQVADPTETGIESGIQGATPMPAGWQTNWQRAAQLEESTSFAHNDAQRLSREILARFTRAGHLTQGAEVDWDEASRHAQFETRSRFANAKRAEVPSLAFVWQEALRNRRKETAGIWQVAKLFSVTHAEAFSDGHPLVVGWETLFQQAMRPPAGMWGGHTVIPPGEDPCYIPPPGNAVDLLFSALATSSTNLLFYCERHPPINPPHGTVVVPVRRVYVVLNEASLRRVDGNIAIPTFSMSLSLDVDSWTWSFSAAVPGLALQDLDSDGEPIEVEALINGVPYRALIESISRERSFGGNDLRIAGRGVSARLDAPYSPVMSFGNTEARTAQQLMGDVLTINGVPMDWAIDWQLEDWNVWAGAFSAQGSYIAALNQIAASAGGYIQPSATGQMLHVLHRYPVAPWKWATDVAPDFQLPAAITTRESIEWVTKAPYNRVFVSGQQSGVLGQVTREGTDGAQIAPMVTDALITEAVAARQRGRAVLSDTGRQAKVTIKLPVLTQTGIITPGKWVDFVDGGLTRRGIVRSVQVEVGRPEIWQSLGLETHESV